MTNPEPKRVLYASHWWLEDLMRAVAHQAAARGWFIDFQMAVNREIPHHWRGDGIITTLSGDPTEIGSFFREAGCPVVSLNLDKPDVDVPRVDIDMKEVGRMAAEHFLERSFRSFAFYIAKKSLGPTITQRAFLETVEKAGLTAHTLDWEAERGQADNNWPNRHPWLRRKLRQLPKPVGVLAVGALDPVEIIEASMAESLRVPDDVAVIGRFDTALFRECTTIPLSNITHDFERHAEVACRLLSQMMDGEPPPSAPILLPPSGIVTRRSTDTIAARIPSVAKAIRYMFGHFAEPIDVPRIAGVCGTSRTRLYAAFNADLGTSPHAVLTRIRLDRAKRMLRETDDKIGVVGEECGFGDQANFFRHFKSSVGLTPGAYRRQHQT